MMPIRLRAAEEGLRVGEGETIRAQTLDRGWRSTATSVHDLSASCPAISLEHRAVEPQPGRPEEGNQPPLPTLG